MKKIISLILLLCMVLSLSACGKVEITMQEIYDAAQTEALLKNHQSVYIRDEWDGEVFSEKYMTKDYVFEYIYDSEFELAEFMTNDVCYCYSSGDSIFFLPLSLDGLSDFTSDCEEYYASAILGVETADETIESVSKKDGRITVTSVLSPKNLEALAEYGVTAGQIEYVLDAKTREMVSIAGNYSSVDDTHYQVASEISYDGEAPEMVKTFLAYMNQTENLRSITVVNNPGTEKEVSQSVQAPKGLILGFRYDDDLGYAPGFYTDAACTESYDPYADTDSDLTIYVTWTE